MLKYYKYFKKDSAAHFKGLKKALKHKVDSAARAEAQSNNLIKELNRRGIKTDAQWGYVDKFQKELRQLQAIVKDSTASDSARLATKRKIKQMTSDKVNRQLAKGVLPGVRPYKMPAEAQRELTKWWRVMKDSTSSDSLKQVAKAKVKSITMAHAMNYPQFQGMLANYKQFGQQPDLNSLSKQVPGLDTLKGAFDSSPDKLVTEAEKLADQNLARQMGLGGYSKQMGEMGKMQNQLHSFSNLDSIKKIDKKTLLKEAENHFADQATKLKLAQTNVSKLLNKFQEFDTNDMSKAVKRTSLQGKTFKERLVLGGNFNVVSMTPFSVDASPMIGYRWNTKFYTGIGLNYRLTFNDSLKYKSYISPSNTSIRVFGNYDLIKNFFAYAETEFAGLKAKSAENSKNEWRVNYFVGLGKKFLIHPKIFMTITCLYNVNGDLSNSSYPSRFQYRIGFTTSDLAFRKKKIYYNP